MRLRNNGSTVSTNVPLRVALVRQGIGHRIYFLSGHEKENSAIKKGVLWLQRDKLFSRWKERYFILTRDYLACFKKGSKIANSDMGSFINKMNLADVDAVEWIEKKGGEELIAIRIPQEGRLFLRAKSGLHEWLRALRETINDSKGRREALRNSMGREIRSYVCDSGLFEREKHPLQATYSDCSPQLVRFSRDISLELRGSTGRLRSSIDHKLGTPSLQSQPRFSLLTDVDLHGELDEDHGIDLDSTTSSSSTPSKHLMIPNSINGHRRMHSHGPSPTKLLDNGILYTCTSVESSSNSSTSRPVVDRSVSDAHHLEVQARRRMKSDRELNFNSSKDAKKRFSGLYPSETDT